MDATAIHPESYALARQVLTQMGLAETDMGTAAAREKAAQADARQLSEALGSDPYTIQDILDAIDSGEVSLEEYHLDQWRLMHIGAQPVPKSLIQRWKKLFPHHEYDTNYGLSESIGPGCVHLGVENIRKVGAIRHPRPTAGKSRSWMSEAMRSPWRGRRTVRQRPRRHDLLLS